MGCLCDLFKKNKKPGNGSGSHQTNTQEENPPPSSASLQAETPEEPPKVAEPDELASPTITSKSDEPTKGAQAVEEPSQSATPTEGGQAVEEPSPSQPATPRKRAVLIGITYKNTQHELKGTINDLKVMKDLLINNLGFLESHMLVLTEEDENPDTKPTKKNMEEALRWLVEGSCSGDTLVFYYAGHGHQQYDSDDDERDGLNETLCPVDFTIEGQILDDYINDTLVRPLKEGVTLLTIVDACHSGTILDLAYVYNRDKEQWEDNSPPSGARKGTNGGLAISISACEDHQEAHDTTVFTGKTMVGAMTHILVNLVTTYPGLTYGDLLDLMYEAIDDANNNRDGLFGGAANCLRILFNEKLTQRPLLSSSEKFDVYKKHFLG